MDNSSPRILTIRHRFLSSKSTIYDETTHAPIGYVPVTAFRKLREFSIYTDTSSQQEFVRIRKRQEKVSLPLYDVYSGNNGPLLTMIQLTTYHPDRYLVHGRIDLFDSQGAPLGYIQDTTTGFNKVIRLARALFIVGPLIYLLFSPLVRLQFDVIYTPPGAAPQTAGKLSYHRSFLKPKLTVDTTTAQARLSPQILLSASSLLNVLITAAVA